jgi:hypothetical protein
MSCRSKNMSCGRVKQFAFFKKQASKEGGITALVKQLAGKELSGLY